MHSYFHHYSEKIFQEPIKKKLYKFVFSVLRVEASSVQENVEENEENSGRRGAVEQIRALEQDW